MRKSHAGQVVSWYVQVIQKVQAAVIIDAWMMTVIDNQLYG